MPILADSIEAKLTADELIEIRAILLTSERAYWNLMQADPKNASFYKRDIERIKSAKATLTNAIQREI